MTTRIEIKAEGGIKLIDQIYEVSRIAAMEVLSKSGNKLRDNARNALRTSKASEWIDVYKRTKSGSIKRTITPENGYKAFGGRQSRGVRDIEGNIDTPPSMANFINSFLMEKNLTMVVGGKHQSFRPKRIRDGKIQGYMPKVSGVSKRSHNILEKLESGVPNPDSNMGMFSNQGRYRMYKGRHFMQKARGNSMSYIQQTMTTTLASLIEKQMVRKQQKVA